MKRSYLLPGISILGGIAGFALRRLQLDTAFEPDTGLPISGTPASMALLALSVAVALLLLLVARNKKSFPMPYGNAFSSQSFAYFLVAAAGAVLLGAGAALTLFDWQRNHTGPLALAFSVFALLAAVCMFLAVARSYRLGWNGQGSLLLLAPTFACCLWLMLSYQSWARDPVVSDYVFALFSIMATMLVYYYMAAFSFGLARPTMTLLCGGLAIYFCIISLADPLSVTERCLYLSAICYTLPHLVVLCRNQERAAPFSNPNAPAPQPAEALKEEQPDE